MSDSFECHGITIGEGGSCPVCLSSKNCRYVGEGKDKIPIKGVYGNAMRRFNTGAIRDTDKDKLDYEGFLSPSVLQRYARYMHKHRLLSDGTYRDSDNWQKGVPIDQYMKSACRHFIEMWSIHRSNITQDELFEEAACALLFNIMGYLHVHLKKRGV